MKPLSPAEVAVLNAAQAKRDAPVIEGVAEVQTIVGKTGPAGKDGRDGVSITGPQGLPGRDGIDGRNGLDGKSITGPRGLAGDPGKDGVGPDEKVKVDAADPKAGFLADKLKAGIGIQIRKAKDGSALVLDSIGTNSAGIPGGGAPGEKGEKGEKGDPGRDGTGGTGSGLPPGGYPGQIVTNTAPGTGDWQDPTGVTPTLADVLTAGHDVGAKDVSGAVGTLHLSSVQAALKGAYGFDAILVGGPDPTETYSGSAITAQGGQAHAAGRLRFVTDGKLGNAADVMTDDGNGYGTWQPQTGGPNAPTADEKAALDAAPTALTALNPAASIADLPSAGAMVAALVASLPTSDPAVAGVLWSNLGVLTVSAGA